MGFCPSVSSSLFPILYFGLSFSLSIHLFRCPYICLYSSFSSSLSAPSLLSSPLVLLFHFSASSFLTFPFFWATGAIRPRDRCTGGAKERGGSASQKSFLVLSPRSPSLGRRNAGEVGDWVGDHEGLEAAVVGGGLWGNGRKEKRGKKKKGGGNGELMVLCIL